MAVMAVEAVPGAAEGGASGVASGAGSRAYTPRHAATQPRGGRPRPRARAARPAPGRGQGQLAPRKNPAQQGGQGQLAPQRANRGNPAQQDRQQQRGRQGAQGQLQQQAQKQRKAFTRTAYHRIVIAEFLATVLIIAAVPFLVPRDSGSGTPGEEAAAAVGSLSLSRPLVRLTAACVVFFMLALLANGQRTGRAAAALGGLVTLGALLNATDALTALGQMFAGAQSATAGVDQGLGQAVDSAAADGGKPVTA